MRFLVIDTETTGLDVDNDDVIEFYGLAIGEDKVDSLHLYIKSNRDSTEQALGKHGLTKEKLNELSTESQKDSLIRIANFMTAHNDSLLVGQNLAFDLSMIKSNFSRYQATYDDAKLVEVFDCFDTMYADKMLKPNKRGKHDLHTLADEYDTKIKPDHSAKNDVFATWQIAMIQIAKMNQNAGRTLTMKELNDNVKKFALEDQESLNRWLASTDQQTRPVGWPYYGSCNFTK